VTGKCAFGKSGRFSFRFLRSLNVASMGLCPLLHPRRWPVPCVSSTAALLAEYGQKQAKTDFRLTAALIRIYKCLVLQEELYCTRQQQSKLTVDLPTRV
jgi:hypothetical protein